MHLARRHLLAGGLFAVSPTNKAMASSRTGTGAEVLLSSSVAHSGAGVGVVARSLQDKLREAPADLSDFSGASPIIKAQTAVESISNGRLHLPAGQINVPTTFSFPDVATDSRGCFFAVKGEGSGEPFVDTAFQAGTRLVGLSATNPTVRIEKNGPVMGAGSIQFGDVHIAGTTNADIPILEIEGLLGLNRIHDFSLVQTGAGDGAHVGWFGGSVMDSFVLLGRTWPTVGDIKTGTGVKLRPDSDIGLGEFLHGTARGYSLGWQIGSLAADTNKGRPLSHRMSMCEVSACTDGVRITDRVEGFHLDQVYIEGTSGRCVIDEARATLITAPYIVLEFDAGIEFRGKGGVIVGGAVGLNISGSKGIVVSDDGSGTRSVFGTQITWGGGSVGTNVGYGIFIEPQSNPRLNLFPDYDGDWTGVSGSGRLVDLSYSAEHGGAAEALGSGVIGYIERRTQGGETLPCFSRGAINLKFDGGDLSSSSIDGMNVLTLSAASCQYLALSAPKTVVRLKAPNLPDKTGWILITNGFVTFAPTASYLAGFTVPEIFGPGEIGAVQYQVVPGDNGTAWITNIYRQKPHAFTVAELPPAAKAGAGFKAFVTDATAPTFGATVVGAGSVATPVFSDGSNWKVG